MCNFPAIFAAINFVNSPPIVRDRLAAIFAFAFFTAVYFSGFSPFGDGSGTISGLRSRS